MSTPVRSILKKLLPTSKYDIVTCNVYPYYDIMLSLTGHQFHAYNGRHLPAQWNKQLAPQPPNYRFSINPEVPLGLDCHFMLIHDRLKQYDIAKMITRFWHLPTMLINQTGPRDMKHIAEWPNIISREGNVNVYLGSNIQEDWGRPGFVVNPGVPVFEYNPKKTKVSHIVVTNEQKRMLNSLVEHTVNYTSGFDFDDSLIFLHTTTNVFPIQVLHAMAAGALVIAQKCKELEGIIEHEYNGIYVDNPADIKIAIQEFKNRPNKCLELGLKARETIEKNYGVEQFVHSMNIAFDEVAKIVYTR